MPLAIILALVLVPVGLIAIVAFVNGQIKWRDVVNGYQIISPIPKASDFNMPLLIVASGGILAGIALLVSANKGNPAPPVPPPPQIPPFSVYTPAGGVSIGAGSPPPYIPPPPAPAPRRGRGP